MESLIYSFIIPVYNRPDEIRELLESFTDLDGGFEYEVVIVEDGSTQTSKDVITEFKSLLNISYFFKENSGPGDSRNFGMQMAKGNYFIVLDSDVILPKAYLTEVDNFLSNTFFHCFGGPDAAHQSFSDLQKAINFSMTSVLTTGGIRGGEKAPEDFEPRSFNLGLSKDAFEASGGFGKIHPGEDPDLVLRLRQKGYKTTLIKSAFVYHKRRISWRKFYNQVYKFGQVRPILNKWHPSSKKITYWFPTLFVLGFIGSVFFTLFNIYYFIILYSVYFAVILLSALVATKTIKIAAMTLPSVCIQFFGYGYGFLKSTLKLTFSKQTAQEIFPKLFFK